MLEQQPMIILLHDRENYEMISRLKSFEIIKFSDLKFNLEKIETTKSLFILTSATGLMEVAEVARAANQKHHLRVLFIREDLDAQWLPQIFDRANLRSMKNTIIYSDSEILKRVLNAWRLGAREQLIANATVIGDRLLVLCCSMEVLEIPFAAMPALQRISESDRHDFMISEEGSYIYWEGADIHLDIDAFRSAIDPVEKQKLEKLRLQRDQLFGQAIKALRQQSKLKQSDITGLSERQVRRIESGEGTKVATLELLAKAHGMELSTYLDTIAGLIGSISDNLCNDSNDNSQKPKTIGEIRKLMGTENKVPVIQRTIDSECPDVKECNS